MNKLMSIIVGGALGLTLAASVGAGVFAGSFQNDITPSQAISSGYDSVYKLDTTGTEQTDSNAYASIGNASITNNNITLGWAFTGNGQINPWRVGGKSISNVERPLYTTTALNKPVDRIEVTFGTKQSFATVNSFAITVHNSAADAASGSNPIESFSPGFTANSTKSVSLASVQTGKYYRFVPKVTVSKNKNYYFELNTIEFGIKQNARLDISVSSNSTIRVGETTTVTATKMYGATGTISWSCDSNVTLGTPTVSGNSSSVVVTGGSAGVANVTASLTGGSSVNPVFEQITVTNGSASSPYSVAEAIAAIDADTGLTDAYTSGIIAQIDSYNSTYHSINYWISDDGTTNNMLEVYSGKGLNGANFSAVTDIEVGAIVTVKGTLKKYNTTYEYDKSSQMISYLVKTLTSITISGSMTKTMYSDGSQWNPAGLVVTAHYNDNTTGDVTGGVTWSYNPATPTLGTTSVVVTASFGGFTVSSDPQAVTVATTPYTNGLPYKMYINNPNASTPGKYYFTGSMGSGNQQHYGASSTNKSQAVDVYFENHTGGGQNLYFEISGTRNYISVVKSTSGNETHYNFSFNSSVPSLGWGYNGNCLTYNVENTDYTIATYGTYTTFGASPASYNTNYPAQFELSDSVTATTFAEDFLSHMTCDATGATAPAFASGYTWADFHVTFSQLPTAEQDTLRNATANESGTTIEQAMARYDYVVAKYSYNNFINRTISNSANKMMGIIDNNSVVLITVVLGLLSTTAFAAFYMLRKRKLD